VSSVTSEAMEKDPACRRGTARERGGYGSDSRGGNKVVLHNVERKEEQKPVHTLLLRRTK
jgi:hypothetical protein